MEKIWMCGVGRTQRAYTQGSYPVAVHWRHARGMNTFLPFKGILSLFIILSSNHKNAYNLLAPADVHLFHPSRTLSRLRTLSHFLPSPAARLAFDCSIGIIKRKEKSEQKCLAANSLEFLFIRFHANHFLTDDKLIKWLHFLNFSLMIHQKWQSFRLASRAYGNQVESIGRNERKRAQVSRIRMGFGRAGRNTRDTRGPRATSAVGT